MVFWILGTKVPSYYKINPFSIGYNSILSFNCRFPFLNILFWIFSIDESQIVNFCVTERTTNKSLLGKDYEAFLTQRFRIIHQLLLSIKWINLIKEETVEWGKLVLEFELLYKILIRYEFATLMRFLYPGLRFIISSRLLNKINTHSGKDGDSGVFSFIIIIFLHLILKYFIYSGKSEFLFRLLQELNSWKNFKKKIFRREV